MNVRMLRRFILLTLLVILPCLASAAEKEDFIPLEDLFTVDNFVDLAISPEGRYLVGLRINKWGDNYVQDLFCFDTEKGNVWQLTSSRESDEVISFLSFVDEEYLLVRFGYARSLERIHITGKEQKVILPSRDTIDKKHSLAFLTDASVLRSYLPDEPGSILVRLSRFGEHTGYLHSRYIKGGDNSRGIYKVNTETLEYELLADNPGGVVEYILSDKNEPALAIVMEGIERNSYGVTENSDELRLVSEFELWLIENKQLSRMVDLETTIDFRTYKMSVDDAWYNSELNEVIFKSDRKEGVAALMSYNLESRRLKTLAKRDHVGISNIVYDSWYHNPIGVSYHDGPYTCDYFDPEMKALYSGLKGAFPDRQIKIASINMDRTKMVVLVWNGDIPGIYYFYDKDTNNLQEIFRSKPWLDDAPLSPTQAIKFKSRDGLDIHGYLTLPVRPGTKAPYPTIVLLHGGPWSRDYLGFGFFVQFYADRGYAVLQINYRGSSGYTRSFIDASKYKWGVEMQDDITDGVQWAIQQGYADADRIAIGGASFGAYLSMMALCKTPGLYKAGIGMMGLYDLNSYYEFFDKEEKEHVKLIWNEWVISPDWSKKDIQAHSPLYLADQVIAPVFLFHGNKDRRVNSKQTMDMARALKNNGVYVKTYYPTRARHKLTEKTLVDLHKKIEKFLRKHFPSDVLKKD